jgi:predicted ABC-type ATPase
MTVEERQRIASFRRLLERLAELRQPFVLVLAGPNGAGKSTFFKTYLAGTDLPFVNADDIAAGFEPGDPDSIALEAAKAADQAREGLLAARTSFLFETVFSDSRGHKLAFLRKAQAAGYAVFLVFIGLESSMLSEARVVHRVRAGGHDVPSERIVDRFPKVLNNLARALPFVDRVFLFDNSDSLRPHRWIATFRRGRLKARSAPLPRWALGLPGMPAD